MEKYIECNYCKIGGYEFCPKCMGAGGHCIKSNEETKFEPNGIKKMKEIINNVKIELLRTDKALSKTDLFLKNCLNNLSKSENTQSTINLRDLILKKQKEILKSKKNFSESKKPENTWNASQILKSLEENKTKEQTEVKVMKVAGLSRKQKILSRKQKIKESVKPSDLVQIIRGELKKELRPPIITSDKITINDFFAIIAESIPEIKEYTEFYVIYNDTIVALTLYSSKEYSVNHIKEQILNKYPILKIHEKVYKKYRNDYFTKFVNNILIELENTHFEDLLKRIELFQNVDIIEYGLNEYCEKFQEESLKKIEELKAEAETKKQFLSRENF